MYVIGLIVSWVRFSAARLPGDTATAVLGAQQLFGAGLRSTLLAAAVFALLSLLAYVISGFRWDLHGQAWHDIVRDRGVGNARDRRDKARTMAPGETGAPAASAPVPTTSRARWAARSKPPDPARSETRECG
ncbi:MAG: hypothetical protein M3010_08720 [Candidatus Dormibacteraeota bacterium]|nr:hypothetical protein [Candidatus Dormibacteraeota bacterium]